MLMVKPGLPYLDMVREVKDKVSLEWGLGEHIPYSAPRMEGLSEQSEPEAVCP
jgi:hypothetical protein